MWAVVLLRAMRTLAEAGQRQAAVVLVRPIWECWCAGLYLLFEGFEGLDRFKQNFFFYFGKLGRALPDDMEPHPLEGMDLDLDAEFVGWPIRQIAEDVERRLRAAPVIPLRHSAVSSYDIVFRFASTFGGTHATWGVFNRYVTVLEDVDRLEVDPTPETGIPPDGAEAFAALWIAELACYVFDAFGIGLEEITPILNEIYVAGNAWEEET